MRLHGRPSTPGRSTRDGGERPGSAPPARVRARTGGSARVRARTDEPARMRARTDESRAAIGQPVTVCRLAHHRQPLSPSLLPHSPAEPALCSSGKGRECAAATPLLRSRLSVRYDIQTYMCLSGAVVAGKGRGNPPIALSCSGSPANPAHRRISRCRRTADHQRHVPQVGAPLHSLHSTPDARYGRKRGGESRLPSAPSD